MTSLRMTSLRWRQEVDPGLLSARNETGGMAMNVERRGPCDLHSHTPLRWSPGGRGAWHAPCSPATAWQLPYGWRSSGRLTG